MPPRPVGEAIVVDVAVERDIVIARNCARDLAQELSFNSTELTLIATAISEVARNIAVYAPPGQVTVDVVEKDGRRGLRVQARDQGPGIENIELAMQDGYSTGKTLGIGLPGARRLMDEFEIVSEVGQGTTVTMRKWRS